MDANNQQIQAYQPQTTKSLEHIFPKGLLNQEAINELKKLIENEQKINREDLHYKTIDTKKDRV